MNGPHGKQEICWKLFGPGEFTWGNGRTLRQADSRPAVAGLLLPGQLDGDVDDHVLLAADVTGFADLPQDLVRRTPRTDRPPARRAAGTSCRRRTGPARSRPGRPPAAGSIIGFSTSSAAASTSIRVHARSARPSARTRSPGSRSASCRRRRPGRTACRRSAGRRPRRRRSSSPRPATGSGGRGSPTCASSPSSATSACTRSRTPSGSSAPAESTTYTHWQPASAMILACLASSSGPIRCESIRKPTVSMPSSRAAPKCCDRHVGLGAMGGHPGDLGADAVHLPQVLHGAQARAAPARRSSPVAPP